MSYTSLFQRLLTNSVVLVQKRCINQWHIIENPKINPSIYDQMIFDKGAETV